MLKPKVCYNTYYKIFLHQFSNKPFEGTCKRHVPLHFTSPRHSGPYVLSMSCREKHQQYLCEANQLNTYRISFMEHDDLEESAKVLSVAMLHNPLHIAVYKGCDEFERSEIEKSFKNLFIQLPGIVFVAKSYGNIVGVMRMKSAVREDRNFDDPQPVDEQNISWRKSFWLNEWAKRYPKDQHWHLGPIGVLPSHRRMGIGSQLMQRFCDEVDNCFGKAYLETDLDENVRFYNKFGFEIASRSTIFEVENKYMIRKSKKA